MDEEKCKIMRERKEKQALEEKYQVAAVLIDVLQVCTYACAWLSLLI